MADKDGKTVLPAGDEAQAAEGERRQVEEELRASEAKYRSLVENCSDLIWIMNQDARLEYVSPSWERVTGYGAGRALGRTIGDLIHPDDADACKQELERALRTKTPSGSEEYRFRNADGSWHYHDTVITPVLEPDGTSVCVVGVTQDTTERRRDQERILGLLAEKDTILKEAHHRVRNYMNTILSLISLKKDALEGTMAVPHLQDVEGCVRSMKLLYDKLYCGEGGGSVFMDDYLPALVREIVDIFPNGGSVRVEDRVDRFELDPRKIPPVGIILNELITNAMKHAFIGREEGRIGIRVSKAGDEVVMVFEDDGPGIPASAASGGSSGFGLQLIDLLVGQLGGAKEIDCSSGARFTIRFKA